MVDILALVLLEGDRVFSAFDIAFPVALAIGLQF
jgi:hypothetical protein